MSTDHEERFAWAEPEEFNYIPPKSRKRQLGSTDETENKDMNKLKDTERLLSEGWITVNGARIMINDETGEVEGGPSGLKGKRFERAESKGLQDLRREKGPTLGDRAREVERRRAKTPSIRSSEVAKMYPVGSDVGAAPAPSTQTRRAAVAS